MSSLWSSPAAVVLTGRGHDGATGAAVVHHQGDVVLATDEATSEVFEMPSAAIRTDDIVDELLPLEQMAGRIHDLVRERGRRSEVDASPTGR